MTASLVLISLLAVWPFSNGKEDRITATDMVPAASGTVQVEVDKDNGNMKLDIKVKHLAQPSALSPSESNYVVWGPTECGRCREAGSYRSKP